MEPAQPVWLSATYSNSRQVNPVGVPKHSELEPDYCLAQIDGDSSKEYDLPTQREMNRSFVQMQYFGYLRRNPNDAPDSNFAGYDFWVSKLNQFNGTFQDAQMVKAFISSSEYRRRFGP